MANSPLYFYFSTLVLTVLLFFPTSKIIWTLSVRRLQRKLGKELTPGELQAQLQRARFIAVFLALVFALVFNNALLGKLYG